MKTYTFYKDNKVVNAAMAETEEQALRICGLTTTEYDRKEEVDLPDVPEPSTIITGVRKSRSDKGTTRKKTSTSPAPAKPGRRAAQFFILNPDPEHGTLSKAMNKTEAEKLLNELNNPLTRVIVGHEVQFVKKIQFKGL